MLKKKKGKSYKTFPEFHILPSIPYISDNTLSGMERHLN